MRLVFFAALLLCTVSAHGQEMIVVPSSEDAVAGETTIFSVYVHNSDTEKRVVFLPDMLTCHLNDGSRPASVVARALPEEIKVRFEIEPQQFIQKRYSFRIPEDLEDTVRMSIKEIDAGGVMFAVTTGAEPEPKTAEQQKPAKEEEYESLESLFTLYQPYLVNISAYEPIYFLVGTDPKESKFQISLKYQFFNKDNPATAKHPWLQGFHFGYTQTSYWDLGSESAPFEDTSYKPELMYLTQNIRKRPAWLNGLYFQTGLQHESNGRGGDLSRSTNHAYFKPILIFYNEPSRLGLSVAPKIWVNYNNDNDTNPHLADYRGNVGLELTFGKADSYVMSANLRWATEGPSAQIDFTYPLHLLFFKELDLYFHAQYVNALAESLIDYTERTNALRLGFSIVR